MIKRIASSLLLLSILFIGSFLGVGCESRNENVYEILYEYDNNREYFPDKKWSKIASPELAGWSTVRLEQARQYSESIHSGAVVVIDNGVVVAEWGNTTTRYKLHSVRKSLMNAMCGVLVDQKKINLESTLKELHITDKDGLSLKEESATIYDLLSARSGVYHPAAYETKGMEEKRPPRGSHDPGTFWHYNNWDFNVLVTIFNQISEKDFFRQFYEKIAQPLQMEQFRLKDTDYYYEPENSIHPAYLFRMSALDLARFGLLYLREGRWRGQQILSADWVHRSIKNYSVFNPKHPERGYGYLWWLSEGVYYAAGTGGQRLFIIPEYKVVIVHRVDTDNKMRVNSKLIWRLYQKIIEAREK